MDYQTYVFNRSAPAAPKLAVHANSQRPSAPAKPVTVLVVDDDDNLCRLLQVSLQRQGYQVLIAHRGTEALAQLVECRVDLVLLDVLMPEMDGFTTCRELRRRSDVPIVMLTALNRPDDIVTGFNLGADDYITKPFTFREVIVRLQAILRRVTWNQERKRSQPLTLHEVAIDEEHHEVRVRGELVHLTPIEFQLLYFLMNAPDRTVSKEDLFRNVWGYDVVGGTNLVEVAMRRLREKVEEDPSQPTLLLTVRGLGYKFNSQNSLGALPAS